MLPIERQNRIKALVMNRHNMKISELSKELQVSEMTIHRDLKPLIKSGIIIKTFGGISLIANEQTEVDGTNSCVFCSRTVDNRQAYRLILANNHIEVTCCAHCGLLRQQQLGDDVIQVLCHDFLKQTTISATSAWFVMNTSIHMGCCQPQVLTFQWKEHADKFVKGFGGNVYPFQEATEVLSQKMKANNHHGYKGD